MALWILHLKQIPKVLSEDHPDVTPPVFYGREGEQLLYWNPTASTMDQTHEPEAVSIQWVWVEHMNLSDLAPHQLTCKQNHLGELVDSIELKLALVTG
jgi:hypothetical protein